MIDFRRIDQRSRPAPIKEMRDRRGGTRTPAIEGVPGRTRPFVERRDIDPDRRNRRGSLKQNVDRRTGSDRRRSRINIEI